MYISFLQNSNDLDMWKKKQILNNKRASLRSMNVCAPFVFNVMIYFWSKFKKTADVIKNIVSSSQN